MRDLVILLVHLITNSPGTGGKRDAIKNRNRTVDVGIVKSRSSQAGKRRVNLPEFDATHFVGIACMVISLSLK